MATITTDTDFNNAASQWLTANSITGATKVPAERKIYDASYEDITPLPAVLEAALDSYLAEIAVEAAEIQIAQPGMAALRNYLDNNMDDLKYGDYFFKLQKKLHDFWRPPRPNLTDRITATIIGLKGDMATDTNHAAMYNTFLDIIQVEYGLTVTSGEIQITGTVPQQAAISRTVIQAARTFMIEGLAMVNMLLANRILS